MGRPRQFDEQQVVVAAADAFRDRGYAATSVDDLVAATGVHRGSLYGTFGSKHGLFLRVLEAAVSPEADPVRRLDLVLVALLELAPTDGRVRERVAELMGVHDLTPSNLGDRLVGRAGLEPRREDDIA